MGFFSWISKIFGIEKVQKGGLWSTSVPLNYGIPTTKGEVGEWRTAHILAKSTPGKYILLRNLYVPYKGKTSEIDLLMIHEKGIFVFESKDYGGWIFGRADALEWTQSLKRWHKYKFYNPIKQNNTHINALMDYLKLPNEHFYSFVVFSDRCVFKDVPYSIGYLTITQHRNLKETMRWVLKNAPALYDEETLNMLGSKLLPLINKSDEEKEHHIDDLNNKCPYCGSRLVVRNGKNGQFFGCSAYPKCKYTRDIGDIGSR